MGRGGSRRTGFHPCRCRRRRRERHRSRGYGHPRVPGRDGEQDEPGRRHRRAHQRRGGAGRPVAEALVEQCDADRRRDHRVGHRHGRQRRGQPGAPVGSLGQQQSGGGQRGDRGQLRPERDQRVRSEALGHRFREHRGHPEGGSRRRGQQDAVSGDPPHPARGQEQYGHQGAGRRQEQALLPARQGLLGPSAPARQGQQPGQPGRGQDGPAPGGGSRTAPYEHGRHREREDDGQSPQRLHQAQRPVSQRHHVQHGAEAVQRDRGVPGGPAHRRVRAVRRTGRDPLLDDRSGRIRHGGHQAQQDRKR